MPLQFFGTSGIRGVVGKELSPILAARIGSAVATYIDSGKVIVGHDTRISSPMIEAALISGLLSSSSNVQKLGLVPTPTLAYSTEALNAAAGIMITASHNPPEYNGVKIFNSDTMAYSDVQQMEIEQIIKQNRFHLASWENLGHAIDAHETSRYVKMVLDAVELKKQWWVVLDCGCGATSHIAPTIFRKLNCKVTTINAQPDGFFPGRSPEPKPETLTHLCSVVKQLKADIGIAYDGDGDRMAVVDENGKMLLFDQLLAAYSVYAVRKYNDGVVVTHVDASRCIDEAVGMAGGKVVRTLVGDVNIAMAIKEHRAIFGGEPVGSWIHPQHHLCPDGILSSALLLEALENEGKTLSQFISKIPVYLLLREKVPCPDELKPKVMEKIQKAAPKMYPKINEILTVDGLRFELPEGWVVIRPSGTEPVIRVAVEAKTRKEAEKLLQIALQTIKKALKEARA